MPNTEKKTKVEEKTKPVCISTRYISDKEQLDIFKRLPLPKEAKKQLIRAYLNQRQTSAKNKY